MSTAFKFRHLFHYEHRRQPLLTRASFLRRMFFAALASALLLALWTFIGMLGYHTLAGLGWVDAFLNSAMIVGGMGPVDILATPGAKVFAGFFAIFSGVVFLSVFGLLIGPVFHRFLHRFHLDAESDPSSSDSAPRTPVE